MQIIRLKPLSVCGTNSYIVASENGNAVLIDAPCDADYILEELQSRNLSLKKILLTHGHFDHIGAVPEIVDKTGCEVYVHEYDLAKLNNPLENLATYFDMNSLHYNGDAISVKDGDVITLDELEFRVIHTPGHTPGSVCYVVEDRMFTGDTLFAGSIGRTDFPDGNTMDMFDSLKKLSKIEGNYIVYPGHMLTTTFDDERACNPYLIKVSEDK